MEVWKWKKKFQNILVCWIIDSFASAKNNYKHFSGEIRKLRRTVWSGSTKSLKWLRKVSTITAEHLLVLSSFLLLTTNLNKKFGIPILVVLIVILVARVTVRTILHSFAGGCYLLGLCRPHHISWCAGYNGDTHRWHHPRWSHITLLHFAQETGVSTTTLTSIQLYMCSCLSMFLTNQEFDLFTYQRQVFHQFMFSFVPSSH